MIERRGKRDVTALLEQRKNSAAHTRVRLLEALDRFEHGKPINLPSGSKLTIRNLAVEAGASKDTPLSRYRRGHPNEGEYRFPEVVGRFNSLREKLVDRFPPQNLKDRKIHELREVIKALKDQLILAHGVNNQLDAESYEKNRYIRELEGQITKLRQDGLNVVSLDKRRRRNS